jgi:hypothetical protein
LRLRAHNLLCIQGFVGKGYSPAFVANMTRVVDSLEEDPEISVVGATDALCSACPHLADNGCTLHGEGTEYGIVHQDRDVMARLGIADGETLLWSEILSRIRARIEPGDLDSICGTCPWLPMGHCKEGLSRLRRRPR